MAQTADQYDFWRQRLAGKTLPIHDGEPHSGFYRLKNRDGSYSPVAYWYADDTLRCWIGGKVVSEAIARERWIWASKAPITHELYKAVLAGEPWPDQHEAVTRSNNAPADDSLEGLQAVIEDLAREAAKLIEKGAAQTKAESDRASDLATKLGELQAKADKARKAEKQVHLDACRAVDGKWSPIIAAADIYKRIKAAVVQPFLAKQLAAKLAAEAEARRQAEAAARAGNAEAVQAAEQRVEAIAATKVVSGTRGRSVGLRSVTSVVITDRDALLGYFHDREELTVLLHDLATAAVKAGIMPAGVKIEKHQQAA